jgi:hypothetical protein
LAIDEALAELRQPPRLAIVYLPHGAADSPQAACLREIHAHLHCRTIGASTGGACFTERGVIANGLCLGLLCGDDFEVDTALIETLHLAPERKLEQAVSRLRWREGAQRSLLVLADPFLCDGEDLLSWLRQALGPATQCFGASAGDNWRFRTASVIHEAQMFPGAVVLAAISTDFPIVGGTRHGWREADQEWMTVTKAEGTRLLSLNGIPAAEAYRQALQRHGLYSAERELIQQVAMYALGAKTIFSPELRVRVPLSVLEDGSLVLATAIREGAEVNIVLASPDSLLKAAAELTHDIGSQLQAECRGALAFDCAARFRILGERYREQSDTLSGAGSHPLLGFASFGELSSFHGQLPGFHNTSTVLACWS